MSRHLYAVHDWSPSWAILPKNAGKTAWCVSTHELGDNPNEHTGEDFRPYADFGVTPIARLNFSHHGRGTIPLPDRYEEFAARCANFVAASPGCTRWIIGNEPNLAGERPNGVYIRPEDYANCFWRCRGAIRRVGLQHQVIAAAVAPYNVDSGPWIRYWEEMLRHISDTGADGLAIHCYSRGSAPEMVTSEDKMNAPYQRFYNGFRAYRDFLAYVPSAFLRLPAYITETDQITPWEDANRGWVRAAYREIDEWNKMAGTQKVWCLALYRWYTHDQWAIQGKNGVVSDFNDTLHATNYLVPIVLAEPEEKVAAAIVDAPAGANIRSGPGTNYKIEGTAVNGQRLPIIGRNADSSWWQIYSAWGKTWIAESVVRTENTVGVPVVNVTLPLPTTDGLSVDWLIGAWSRVLGINPILAKAVLEVESAGDAFQGGRMVIRFENHVFHDKLKQLAPSLLGTFAKHFQFGSPRFTGHKFRLSESAAWNVQHDGGQNEEWQVFTFARSLHEAAAMRAISMGSAQILGDNFSLVGYPTVQEMFHDYSDPTRGEVNQVVGFFAYVLNVRGLRTAMQQKDWNTIAAKYNGTANVAVYAPLLAKKYAELGGA